jgi:hypothetical protein
MTKAGFVLAISGLLLVAYDRSLAQAAELKVFCPIAMKGVMAELLPQFERSSAQKMMIEYGTVGSPGRPCEQG